MIAAALLLLCADPPPVAWRVVLAGTAQPTPAASALPLPLDGDGQRVASIETPTCYALARDRAAGTRWLRWSAVATLPSVVNYRVELVVRPFAVEENAKAPQKLPAKALAAWLPAGPANPAAEGARVAGTAGDARARARKLFDHAARAAKNPAEFAAAFAALCGDARIPARVESGFMLAADPQAAEFGPAAAWASFHDPERGWTPVEPNGFGQLAGLRVAFARGKPPDNFAAVAWKVSRKEE